MINRRRTYVVDKEMQFHLVGKTMFWWIAGGLLILAIPILVNFATGVFIAKVPFGVLAKNLFATMGFPFLAGMTLILFGARRVIVFSNRIAGPVYRLNKEIKNAINDQNPQKIRLRKNDFFVGVADNFNALLEKIESLESTCNELKQKIQTEHLETERVAKSLHGIEYDAKSAEELLELELGRSTD